MNLRLRTRAGAVVSVAALVLSSAVVSLAAAEVGAETSAGQASAGPQPRSPRLHPARQHAAARPPTGPTGTCSTTARTPRSSRPRTAPSGAHAPENSVPAILAAFEDGAKIVELDIQLTADGVPVLMHDTTVDRTTDGTGRVDSLTLAQIEDAPPP